MRKIAHIVNPVVVEEESDLFVAQPITLETMRVAREFARGQVEVELYSAQYPEDRSLVPTNFQMTPDLDRSILDFGAFRVRRKLPLLKDILDRLYEATKAEYLIYTNVDIALMPHFYTAVSQLIDQGYDAFIINKRIISKTYQRLENIPLMYAQVGGQHKGYDCFIFKRDVYPRYCLGDACIGTGRVGEVLAVNLIYNATKFEEFRDQHLTFHLGNDKVWKSAQFADYLVHNRNELKKTMQHYDVLRNPRDHPVISRLVCRYGERPGRLKRAVNKAKRLKAFLGI